MATRTQTYNSGSGTETAQAGDASVVPELVGGGAGGSVSGAGLGGGGAGGSYAAKNPFAIAAGDSTPYTVAASAAGKSGASTGSGTIGNESHMNNGNTATGGFATAFSTLMRSGQSGPGTITTGGTASTPLGGDTNTAGSNGTTGTGGKGGNAASGGVITGGPGGANAPGANQAGTNGNAQGGGGGGGESVQKGGDGAAGRDVFTYTLSSGSLVILRNTINRPPRFTRIMGLRDMHGHTIGAMAVTQLPNGWSRQLFGFNELGSIEKRLIAEYGEPTLLSDAAIARLGLADPALEWPLAA